MKEALLSGYGNASTIPSPVNKMMAAFAADFRDGVDVNLGVGYVNERTIPDARILEAMESVLAHPETHRLALNYGGPRGSQNLIDAIQRFHVTQGIGGLTDETFAQNEVVIGSSGATSILEGIADVIEPGIVITSDPMYYIYCNCLERKGFEVVAVPEDDAGIDTDALEDRLRALDARKKDVRFFYIVTVNNPTCTILSNARRRAMVDVAIHLSAELGRKIPVFFDKAYELLIHDPTVERPESALLYDDAGVVYEIGTLSKVLAPALRIGYLMGPDAPLVNAMVQKTSDVGFSAPLVTQEMAAYLLDHHIAEQMDRVNCGYREKARQVKAWIDEHLGDALAACTGGSAGFYFYLTFRDIETHERSPFFKFLSCTAGDENIDGPPARKHPRVIYIPGEFCVHPRGVLAEIGKRQLRLSYGFEELERIGEALTHMKAAAAHAVG